MHLVTMTALRPLYGDYGHPSEGETFTTDSRTAQSLEARGLAERYRPDSRMAEALAKMLLVSQNKMMPPAENKVAVGPMFVPVSIAPTAADDAAPVFVKRGPGRPRKIR